MKKICFALLAVILALFGCGSDDSDSSSSEAGRPSVGLEVEPEELDTGDRVMVRISVESEGDNLIELKLRYPRQFSYVQNSAQLFLDETSLPVAPGLDLQAAHSDERYLVFYFNARLLEPGGGAGEITLELTANDAAEDVEFAVDADVAVGENFDPEQPQFTAQDSAFVSVLPED